MRQFTCLKAVTHPSTNWAQCRATALIETNALTLHQTANRILYCCDAVDSGGNSLCKTWFDVTQPRNNGMTEYTVNAGPIQVVGRGK